MRPCSVEDRATAYDDATCELAVRKTCSVDQSVNGVENTWRWI